jgi:pilus assembly protein CpaB
MESPGCAVSAFVGVKSPSTGNQGHAGGHHQHHAGAGCKDRDRSRQIVAPDNFRWQEWLQATVNSNYVQRNTPNAVSELAGAVARAPLSPGDPITPYKLVKAGEGGVLAAILPAGMRAISTRIKEETGVGKLILPNDHVDVILTVRKRGRAGGDEHVADTLFRNVRVLAIGQLIEAREGKKLAEGNTATRAQPDAGRGARGGQRQGRDLAGAAQHCRHRRRRREAGPDKQSNTIKVLRYGAKSRVYGFVN